MIDHQVLFIGVKYTAPRSLDQEIEWTKIKVERRLNEVGSGHTLTDPKDGVQGSKEGTQGGTDAR